MVIKLIKAMIVVMMEVPAAEHARYRETDGEARELREFRGQRANDWRNSRGPHLYHGLSHPLPSVSLPLSHSVSGLVPPTLCYPCLIPVLFVMLVRKNESGATRPTPPSPSSSSHLSESASFCTPHYVIASVVPVQNRQQWNRACKRGMNRVSGENERTLMMWLRERTCQSKE